MIDPTHPDDSAAAADADTDPSSVSTPAARLRRAHQERRDRPADAGSVNADPWDDARPGDMELLRRMHAERTAR